MKDTIGNSFTILPLLFTLYLLTCCKPDNENNIVIENPYFRYEINRKGDNNHFIDKASAVDFLKTPATSFCAYVEKGGKVCRVTSVSRSGNNLRYEFDHAGVTANIHLKTSYDHIVFKVISVTGDPESLTFINVPLKLEGMPYEPFAACVLSMNLFTHVRQMPALQTDLWATCYKKFGLKGAEITLLGVPQQKILPVIREVMEHNKDLPHSDKGGAWALSSKEGYGSYLMNFGTLTGNTVDEWITMCKSLGFNQIDNHGGGGFFRFGDFELNREKWPEGWDAFKKINDQLHEAGISSIFHTYAFFIDKNSKYVTPVPSKDLGYFSAFTLAEPLDSSSNDIIVRESTANISTITGFFVRNSRSLRIGNELIEFSGVTNAHPFRFTGCKRGVNGTKPSSHEANEKIFHLQEMFGRFVPGPETRLFDEIAHNTADIVNNCGFDGIYFDAIDGSDILGGDENFWYYGTSFIFEVARQLEKPVGMEMSSMSHHWWHYRSRWQAWDRPVRGYKRFVDIHLASIKAPYLFLPKEIKSNENEHGLWRGHSPLIDKFSPVENGALLLPLHLGWWGNQTWNPPQVEPTFTDDVEYLCCKMIGNNAGLSMLGGVDRKTLDETPLFKRLTEIIKQYEELRHQNFFSDTIRYLLRQPGKEYTLFRDDNSGWNFKPVFYRKHKVAVTDHTSAQWIVNNEFDPQQIKLRIEPLMSVKPYEDPLNIVLSDNSMPDEFKNEVNADGATGDIKLSAEKVKGGATALFSAANATALSDGKYIEMRKTFTPWLDLSKNQALGVWIKGDGNGEILNLRIESPKHMTYGARGDHFVKIDFTGWKYFELVETESSEFSNYIWPDSGFYVYNSYRHQVQFGSVDKLQLWYNNIPAGKEVKCLIGPVKAIPLVPITIENPAISIGDRKILFPVKMESGMYLEFKSKNDCKLYGSKGEFLQDISIEGIVPILASGDNEIIFSCKGNKGISSRVQITVIGEGNPILKR